MSAGIVWKEATAADGRTYYWNTSNKETRWDRPPEMASVDQAAVDASWKETTASDGRKYYYNSVTLDTVWNAPEAFLKAQQQRAPATPAEPAFVAGGLPFNNSFDAPRDHGHERGYGLPQRPAFEAQHDGGRPWERKQQHQHQHQQQHQHQHQHQQDGYRGPMAKLDDEPEYATVQEAEAAFFKMLSKKGVKPDWSWDKTMRAVIRDPQYRSLKDPQERREAFEKYVVEMKAKERQEANERLEKVRQDFKNMLRMHDEIKHYTRWKTAKPLIQAEAAFKTASDEDERRQMFDDYIAELKRKHADEEASMRRDALGGLSDLVRSLNLDPNIRWAEAQGEIMNNERFVNDDKFQVLGRRDVLQAFEQRIMELERERNDAKQATKRMKYRMERKARDGFKELLQEMKVAGKVGPGAKWKELHPLIKDDPRFIAMLDAPPNSSSALDLFWDAVQEEEAVLRMKRHDCLDVLEATQFEMKVETPFEEFEGLMKANPKTSSFSDRDLQICFERLMEKVVRRAEDARAKAEKQQRYAIDELRSAIKHLKPAVVLGDTWAQVRPLIEADPAFHALGDEEARRAAFDKHMARLREKEEERARRDARHESFRDRDRDRAHRPRSPEVDAYAEERRKAQADRERQFKRGSGSFGRPPPPAPPRERERERERFERRAERQPSGTVYDRERRNREHERERNFMNRADPREKQRTLNYGDDGGDAGGGGSAPGSIRKRKDSDGSARDAKRVRRPRTRTRTPEPRPDEPELQSGSEEGEIEEVL